MILSLRYELEHTDSRNYYFRLEQNSETQSFILAIRKYVGFFSITISVLISVIKIGFDAKFLVIYLQNS